MKKYTKRDWPTVISQLHESGMSVIDFAKKKAISPQVLNRNLKKFGNGKTHKTPGHFVQVGAPETFEVEKNGVKLRLSTNVDAATLQRLLGILDGPR